MSKHNKPKHRNRHHSDTHPQPNRAGDKINYHVLKCRPIINRTSPQIAHDHLQVLLEIESGTRYWMTINIRSGQDKVFYVMDENYKHPITQTILTAALPQGFTPLRKQPGGLALDYLREELVDVDQMDEIEATTDPNFDGIADALTTQLVNVSRFDDARLFIFGSKFEDGARFSSYDLAVGIHDIHMNQGSRGGHAGSNGIFQDGAMLAFYPTETRWSAVLLKFASQSSQTDENGNPAVSEKVLVQT